MNVPSRTGDPGPLVSIVTPTLNRSELLESVIRSVRAQSYPNIEHIVMDGGSTDDTPAMLGRYADTPGLRWVSEPDRGMYHAINKGLHQARGEIQAYLNSDDLYFPWAVGVAVDIFLRHPEVDVVYGDVMNLHDAAGRIRPSWNLPFDFGYLARFGYMWQPAVFWRKRVFDAAGGFDESIRFSADLEFWLRLAAHGARFRKVNEFLAVARIHADTITLVQRPRILEELAEMRAKYGRDTARGGRWGHDRSRRAFWYRGYWIAFMLQSVVPKRLRRGPWSRFLGSGQARISYVAVALEPVRRFARWLGRVGGHQLQTGPNWLEPPG